MPATRNALIRYKTIDNCLRNRFRQWTLEDLIDACSEALYDYEGIDKGVSKRTIQMDLQIMRSDKLGYHAPIVVSDKKFYTYSDPEYSITNVPLTDQDLNKLTEVVDILRQFKGFSHFSDLSGMVQKLENKIHTSSNRGRSIIDLEKNEDLRGLEYIDPIFQAISNEQCINISYQSFKAKQPETFLFHPALLKEYRNRWFVLGKRNPELSFMLLALDRIQSLEISEANALTFDPEVLENFFSPVVGVTVSDGMGTEEVIIEADHSAAPYVLTKPIHHSQQLLKTTEKGVLVSLQVQLNFELERELMGFGENVKVLAPERLVHRIKTRLSRMTALYTE